MDALFDGGFDVLSKSLDLHLLRHTLISDNIANAETPHFKARRVEFEGALQNAIDQPTTADISSVKPNIYEDAESEVGQDLNTVDMDREMADMTKNDVKYSAISQAVSKKFALLQYAIQEGGSR